MSRLLLLPLFIGLAAACSRDKPSSDKQLEMGPPSGENIKAHTADPAVLSDFKSAYESARKAPRPVFVKFLPLLGAAPMLDFLEERYPACHGQAHELGKALFAQSGDLGVALRECDRHCTAGCMHGVLAEAFGRSTPETITAKANAFCTEGEMARLHKPGNCAHGLGHAFMFIMGGDVKRSVDACLGFAQEAMQYYCATGAYMEAITTGRRPGQPAASVHHPCEEETVFPAACYRYKGPALLKEFGGYRGAEHECLRLDRPHQLACFHGLGHASIDPVFDIPQRMATACSAGDRDDRVVCIEGVIEKLAEYDEGRAKIACGTLRGDLRVVCNQAVQRQMYGLETPTFALYYDRGAVARRRASLTNAAAPVSESPAHTHH